MQTFHRPVALAALAALLTVSPAQAGDLPFEPDWPPAMHFQLGEEIDGAEEIKARLADTHYTECQTRSGGLHLDRISVRCSDIANPSHYIVVEWVRGRNYPRNTITFVRVTTTARAPMSAASDAGQQAIDHMGRQPDRTRHGGRNLEWAGPVVDGDPIWKVNTFNQPSKRNGRYAVMIDFTAPWFDDYVDDMIERRRQHSARVGNRTDFLERLIPAGGTAHDLPRWPKGWYSTPLGGQHAYLPDIGVVGTSELTYNGLADCEITISPRGTDWKITRCQHTEDPRTVYQMEWFHDRARNMGIVVATSLKGPVDVPINPTSKVGRLVEKYVGHRPDTITRARLAWREPGVAEPRWTVELLNRDGEIRDSEHGAEIRYRSDWLIEQLPLHYGQTDADGGTN